MNKRKNVLAKIMSICLVFLMLFAMQIPAFATPIKERYLVTIKFNGGYWPAHPEKTKQESYVDDLLSRDMIKEVLPKDPPIIKEGHTFNGYYCQNNGKTYRGGDLDEINPGNTVFVMQWKANTYKITYNKNGGSGGPTYGTKTYGQTLYLDSRIPKKDGYKFTGWKCSVDGEIYQPGDAFKLNQSCTMTAQWETGKPEFPSGFVTITEIFEYFSALVTYLVLSIFRKYF